MDVKVEVGVCSANAVLNESKVKADVISYEVISVDASSLYFTPVITVSGHSISSVNPDFNYRGVWAAA